MRTTIKFMMSTVMLVGSFSSFAGSGGGNGGGLHYCEDATKTRMYDIYEGQKRYRLDIVETEASLDEVLNSAISKIEKINPSLAMRVFKQIAYVRNENNFVLDKDINLKVIPDANILMTDKGCSYKQLANWDEVTGKIFVDETLYVELSDFQKAALILHEAIYKVGRDTKGQKDSDLTRRAVAEILSTSLDMQTLKKDFLTLLDGPPKGFFFFAGTLYRSPSCKEPIRGEIINKGRKQLSITTSKNNIPTSKVTLKANQDNDNNQSYVFWSDKDSVTDFSLSAREVPKYELVFEGCGISLRADEESFYFFNKLSIKDVSFEKKVKE